MAEPVRCRKRLEKSQTGDIQVEDGFEFVAELALKKAQAHRRRNRGTNDQ
jgi:hypothetical protein